MKFDWVVGHLFGLQEHFETGLLQYCPFLVLDLDIAGISYNFGGLSRDPFYNVEEYVFSNNIPYVARNGHRAIISYMPTSTLISRNAPAV